MQFHLALGGGGGPRPNIQIWRITLLYYCYIIHTCLVLLAWRGMSSMYHYALCMTQAYLSMLGSQQYARERRGGGGGGYSTLTII